LLHKPRLIVIGEALDTLEADARNRVISLFKDKLKDAGIINIGRLETDSFFTRVLHLVKDPQDRCFLPNLRVSYSPTYSPA
jgi:putative ATP-binding cassette transporter